MIQGENGAIQTITDAQHITTPLGGFTVVISDMDGTVLNSNHRLSECTKDTLYKLSLKGVHFIFATGRHHLSVATAKKDLIKFYKARESDDTSFAADGKSVEGFFLITSNGARVQNPSGDFIFVHNLDSDIARTIYDKFSHRNRGDDPYNKVTIAAYQTEKWWQSDAFLTEEQMMEKFGFLPEIVPNIAEDFPTEGVGKICFRCDNATILHEYEKELIQMFPGKISVAMSSNTCVDVMPFGVSKASASREIGLLLDFDPAKNAIAFGDSMNDMEMLRSVAKGCIMQNAQDRLKEALPQLEIIKSNDEEGVASKLMDVFNMQNQFKNHL